MKAVKVIVSFDNGSVPPQYAYRYRIIFSEQEESARLEFFRGYGTDEKMVVSDQRKFNPEIFSRLFSLLHEEENPVKNSTQTGGSQRIIDTGAERIVIAPDDEAGISLFNRFLYLYNPDFSSQINNYINP